MKRIFRVRKWDGKIKLKSLPAQEIYTCAYKIEIFRKFEEDLFKKNVVVQVVAEDYNNIWQFPLLSIF